MESSKIIFRGDESFAFELDENDPLRAFKQRFFLPKDEEGREAIYLCGNSLGLQPKEARRFINEAMQEWGERGVEGHFAAKDPWVSYHELLNNPMAKIVGALPSEVVVMNSLTVNLHLLLVSFYRPTKERYKILTATTPFPSDQYAVASHAKFHGYSPEEVIFEVPQGHCGEWSTAIERSLHAHGDEVALILIDGVNYYSGYFHDLKRITEIGHEAGCVVGFDLAHAVGNVPLALHEWGVDFAVWCSYKYLNGGPGCSGGCFVHERHHSADLPRFAGWWGHDKERRFFMEPTYQPIVGAEGWQLSNPPILPLASLRASLKLFEEVGMEAIRAKSVLLTSYLEYLIAGVPGVEVITSHSPDRRGAQLSLRLLGKGKETFHALQRKGVICDWREPDAIRIAPVPLYNSFFDVYRFVGILSSIL